jgi:hypothetical protein
MPEKPVPACPPSDEVSDAPGQWTPKFHPFWEIDCGTFFLLLRRKAETNIPNAYQEGERVIRLAAAAPLLQIAVEAALNMVDGDGAPPRWDMLRAALAKARGEKPSC